MSLMRACIHFAAHFPSLNGAYCRTNPSLKWSLFGIHVAAVSCGDPGTVPGGQLVCPTGHTYSGLCIIVCNKGYRSTGSLFARCQADKSWTPVNPCKGWTFWLLFHSQYKQSVWSSCRFLSSVFCLVFFKKKIECFLSD